MTGRDDFVGRVRGSEFFYRSEYFLSRVLPRLPEAFVRCAALAEICVYVRELEVCDPVINGSGTTEGDDDEFVGRIQADVSGDIC